MKRRAATLLGASLLAAGCTLEEATPTAPTTPIMSTAAPTFLGARVPVEAEQTRELEGYLYLVDGTRSHIVGLHAGTGYPGGFQLVAADLPTGQWRTAYTSTPGASWMGRLAGSGDWWSFVETNYAPGLSVFDIVTTNVVTGEIRRLDHQLLPQETNARLAQRARPAIAAGPGVVAWSRLRADPSGFVWELLETSVGSADPAIQVVRSAREPLIPLAFFDGRLAYAVATSERDELWVHSTATGTDVRWPTTATRLNGAAWSEAGLVVAQAEDSRTDTSNAIALIAEDRGERVIANRASCPRVAADGRYVTWGCGRSDLRAYDLRSGTYPFVAHAARAEEFHVAQGAFVWSEFRDGTSSVHLVVLPP